ncbi:MAG TPA: hypothetical protein VM452_12170 [Caulifigura sp.]|jgi:Tol biopolymer transport system component|nr:hypothetical protein [Caulifigura sp.]
MNSINGSQPARRGRPAPFAPAVLACLLVLLPSAESLQAQGLAPLKVPAAVYELGDDGSGWKQVFTPGDFVRIGSLRLTPDGSRLCFDGVQAGEHWNAARLLSCRLDGTDLKEYGRGAMPNFSPDNTRISFCDYAGATVRVLTPAENSLTTIADGWGVQWSPVSNEIAYVVGGSVVIHDVDSGRKRPLFPADNSPYQGVYYNMAWSHDGRQIAIQGTRPDGAKEIAVVDSQGAEFGYRVITPIQSLSNFVAFHPAGKKLAIQSYITGNACSQLFQVSVDPPGEPVVMKGQPADFDNVSACWTDGGQKLRVISWQRMPPAPKP